jgi:CHAT domain-containing protein
MLGEIANTLGSELSKESRERAAAIRSSAQVVEQERQTVQESIVSRFPRYASLISNAAVSIDEVRNSLRPNEAILSTLVGERVTHVWTIRRDQAPQWVQIPIGFEATSRRVSQLRRSLDPGEWIGQRVVPFDLDAASRLHSALIGPVKNSLHAIEKLIVVADGPLARLPFGVLVRADPKSTWSRTVDYRDVHWLVRDYAIAQSPSLTSFVQLRASPHRSVHERNFIGIGDPLFRPENSLALRTISEAGQPIWRRMPGLRNAVNPRLADLPSLPDTNIEVRAVARILNADADRDVWVRERASEANARSEAVESARVLLFATHGLAAGDLSDLNEPALALSSPSVVGGSGDGLLTASEIVSLLLSADWVVLSACSTADYDSLGVKSLFGLSSAFFYAGARALLVTHWPVETRAASAIVVKTFEHYQQDPKSDKAQSLQSAMLWFIDERVQDDPSGDSNLRHPAFWAPFSLIGD